MARKSSKTAAAAVTEAAVAEVETVETVETVEIPTEETVEEGSIIAEAVEMAKADAETVTEDALADEPGNDLADANDPAWAKDNFAVARAALDQKFLDSLGRQSAPVKIGVLRADWCARFPTFASLKKGKNDKQQKAIMRRTLNRLMAEGKVHKAGMMLSLTPFSDADRAKFEKAEKAEVAVNAEAE